MTLKTIPLTDRVPVEIDTDVWRVIAMANEERQNGVYITVWAHPDGRRIVCGGVEKVYVGYYSGDTYSVGGTLNEPLIAQWTVDSINAAGVRLDSIRIAREAIARLPPRKV